MAFGIPANICRRSLNRFTGSTTNAVDKSGGVGLGLAFVKRSCMPTGGQSASIASSVRVPLFRVKLARDTGLAILSRRKPLFDCSPFMRHVLKPPNPPARAVRNACRKLAGITKHITSAFHSDTLFRHPFRSKTVADIRRIKKSSATSAWKRPRSTVTVAHRTHRTWTSSARSIGD